MDASFLSENQPELDQKHTTTRFIGKVVIVTGGASGIGYATVERFLNDGAYVAIFDINQEAGEAHAARETQKGYKCDFFKVDVSDKGQCTTAVAEVANRNEGKIHVLVNCVVYFNFKGLDATKEDWDKSLSVNVVSYANMVQACHPYMKTVGRGCAILNVSSTAAFQPLPNLWTYSSTKGAIYSLTKNMALDLGHDGIRVNSISPGTTWTPVIKKLAEEKYSDKDALAKTFDRITMLHRMGETSEMAAAICFLCSADASYITGTNLGTDGGYGAMGPEAPADLSFNSFN